MITTDFFEIKMSAFKKFSRKINAAHTLAISFFVMILLGTGLLLLPWSCQEDISFIDALFTSTSATCVTGLAVVDTGLRFTLFGQMVILGLIQLGGLGIMTFSSLFGYIFTRRLSIKSHVIAEEAVGGLSLPKVGRLLLAIVLGTFVIEIIGSVLLAFRFSAEYPWSQAFYLGVFHSISAFCNAGFSLFSTSLVGYSQDWIVNVVIIFLIILGGIGFWVIIDVINVLKKRNGFRALTLHSKIVLSMTGTLIFVGMVGFLFFEWHNTLSGLSLDGKLLSATFLSVTARTAGFNTVPIDALTNSTLLLLIIFMMIGASPGSCGGGIKTTSFTVMIAMIFARLRDRQQVRLFKRGVPELIVSRVIGIVFLWLVTVIVVTMVMLVIEHPGGPHEQGRTLFLEVIFEVFSAMGTVGLSTGLTPTLTGFGKFLIIVLMYIGRIGPFTMALIIVGQGPSGIKVAEEKFAVG